jgi:hypothetical protein
VNYRIGRHTPSVHEIERALQELHRIEKDLEKCTVDLTVEERRSVVKFRFGGERILALIAELAREAGVDIPGAKIEDMQHGLILAERLSPLTTAVAALLQRLEDTILEARSEAWSTVTIYYGVLQQMARTDARLATKLEPIVEFFALGKRPQKAPEAPPKVSPP